MSSLVVMLLLAQFGGAPLPAGPQPALAGPNPAFDPAMTPPKLYAPFSSTGPLFQDLPGTAVHVTWPNGALFDSMGNTWTQTGTAITANFDSPLYPNGFAGLTHYSAGPFSAVNNFQLGTGSDALDFTGAFTVCVLAQDDGVNAVQGLISDELATNQAGWRLVKSAAGVIRLITANAGSFSQAVTTFTSGALNIFCAGHDGTTGYVKANLGATVTSIGPHVPATGSLAYIGRDASGTAWGGRAYEVWATRTTPSDAAFTTYIKNAWANASQAKRVFTDDANTVVHVTWDGLTLVDSKGNAWAKNGTVVQTVEPNGTPIGSIFTPSRKGAGGFTDNDYYSIPSGGVLDPADGAFTMCAVFRAPTSNAGSTPTIYSSRSGAGWLFDLNAGAGVFTVRTIGSGGGACATSNSVPFGGVGVACVTRDPVGPSGYVTLNGEAACTAGAMTYAQKTTGSNYIGRSQVAGQPFDGAIYELWYAPVTTPLAQLQAIAARAAGKLLPTGQTLTVARAGTAVSTYTVNGKVWNAAPNTPRIENDGLLVEHTRTNYALQSETTCVANAVQTPWALTGTPTCTSDAVAAPTGVPATTADTWTSTANTDLITQPLTTASSSFFSLSQWFRRTTTGTVTLQGTCPTNVVTCNCMTSNSRYCAATAATTTCTATMPADTTWTRLMLGMQCTSATTTPTIGFAPGQLGVSTGTASVWGAQAEVPSTGALTAPQVSSYMATGAATVARDNDFTTTTNPFPANTTRFCGAAVITPQAATWGEPNGGDFMSIGAVNAANSWRFRKGNFTLTLSTVDALSTTRSLSTGSISTFTTGGALGAMPPPLATTWGSEVPASQAADLFYTANGVRLPGSLTFTGFGAYGAGTVYFGTDSFNGAGTIAAGSYRDVRLYANRTTCEPGSIYPTLFDDDASTVSHLVWRNGAMVDLKGTTWTTNGSPTVNNTYPPSNGNWSDAIYYSAPAGSINPTAAPFTACFAMKLHGTGVSGPGILDMRNSGTGNGVTFGIQGGGPSGVTIVAGGVSTTNAANTLNRGEIGVWCAGNNGTQNLVKLGSNTITTANATFAPDLSIAPFLGRSQTAGTPFSNGNIYEVWLTRTTPSDALFTYKIKTAMDRMKYVPAQ